MSNLKKRVYYVWNYRKWGGAQIYFFSIIRQARLLYNVKVLIPEQSPARIFEYLENLDIPYAFLPEQAEIYQSAKIKEKFDIHRKKILSENRLVKFVLSQPEIEQSIVHIDLGFWQSFLPLLRLARKTNVVTTIHTALPKVSKLINWRWKTKGRIISRKKNYTALASNEDAKKSLIPFFAADKFSSVKIAYSGFNEKEIENINRNPIEKTEIFRRYGLPDDRFYVVTVGQFY